MNQRRLQQRIEFWRKRIIPEWRAAIMDHPPPDGADEDFFAICQVDARIREIRVYFTVECLARPDGDVERTIVHELLHALTYDLYHAADGLESHAARAAWTMYLDQLLESEERIVDRLAWIILGAHLDQTPRYFTGYGAPAGGDQRANRAG